MATGKTINYRTSQLFALIRVQTQKRRSEVITSNECLFSFSSFLFFFLFKFFCLSFYFFLSPFPRLTKELSFHLIPLPATLHLRHEQLMPVWSGSSLLGLMTLNVFEHYFAIMLKDLLPLPSFQQTHTHIFWEIYAPHWLA